MRILIISQYFWPENFRINDLAIELATRGHAVTVLSGLPNYPDGKIFDAYKKHPSNFNNYKNVNIIRVPLFPRGSGKLRLLFNYLSFTINAIIFGVWKLRKNSFDVIFVNQLSPVTVGLVGAFFAGLKKAPMVMWVLDLWPDTLQAIGIIRSPKILRLIEKLVSIIYKNCDLILSQSKSFIPLIKKNSHPNENIEYIPSWAEELFKNKTLNNVFKIPHKKNSFNIVFAGNIGEAQDFPCILNAAEILKNNTRIRWVIIGDGRMKDWVKKEIISRELNNNVILLGNFPLDYMPSFYQQADALLVTLQDKPIFAMTIPGKLQSYLASGKPVLAALNSEGAELIKEGRAGMVSNSGDPEGLAQIALALSKSNSYELLEFGECSRRVSDTLFQRDVVINKIEKLLLETILKKSYKL